MHLAILSKRSTKQSVLIMFETDQNDDLIEGSERFLTSEEKEDYRKKVNFYKSSKKTIGLQLITHSEMVGYPIEKAIFID